MIGSFLWFLWYVYAFYVLTNFLSILINIVWVLYLVDCLHLIYLVLFVKIPSVISLGACFFISFWLPHSVCLYVLGRTTICPSLGMIAYVVSMCPVGPSGNLPDHLNWMLPECSCMDYIGFPLVVESLLFLVHVCCWLTVKIAPDHSVWAAVLVMTTQHEICLSRVSCLPRSPFGYIICEVTWILFWCYLKPVTRCCSSGFSCEGIWWRSISLTACDLSWATCLELRFPPHLLAASAGSGCVWERLSCVPKPAFIHSEPKGRPKVLQVPPLPSSLCQLHSKPSH